MGLLNRLVTKGNANPARRGFYDPTSKPVPLTRKSVDGIQLQGGTILGTSRGGANLRCAIIYLII